MSYLINVIKNIDLLFYRYLQIISPEKPALIVFTFHKIFKNKSDIFPSGVDPQQGTTLTDFRLFIEYFLSAGYVFVHPEDIPTNLNPSKKYILITFDDGYFNNSFVLPIIKEYKSPSIFFITSNNILYNEAFWWDIVYRLKNKGVPTNKIAVYKRKIKKMNSIQVRNFLKINLSNEDLEPKNDYDRPFNEKELKHFSKEPYVVIGNHTADHSILTNCSRMEIENQIVKAQDDLENITGKTPRYISYPNGNYSNEVIDIVQKLDIRLGFTTIRGKNFLPITVRSDLFKIQRFMLSKACNIEKDGLLFRSNYSLYNSGINIYSKLNSINIKW